MIKPYYRENNIPIVFASDEKFKYMLSASIKSLIENVSKKYNYDIIIINTDIEKETEEKLKSLNNKTNVNIRFYDIKENIEEGLEKLFYTRWEYSKAAYFRLFIPKIFINFDKVLYFDSDLIFLKDISELYYMEIQNNYVIGAIDYGILYKVNKKDKTDGYYVNYIQKNLLNMDDYKKYFSSGVMVFNVKLMIEDNLFEKFIEELKRIKTPVYVEQDILNSVCQKKVKILDGSWNVFSVLYMTLSDKEAKKTYKKSEYIKYKQYQKDPKIIHYCYIKPYYYKEISKIQKPFWKYAKMTPYYKEMCEIRKKSGKYKVIVNELTLIAKIKFTIRLIKSIYGI